jgi:hypothetical protein
VAALAAVAGHLAHGHPGDVQLFQAGTDVVQGEGLDDRRHEHHLGFSDR